MSVTSRFLFATCQKGAERALKAELARTRPDLHPAFQRPGLVTFKCAADAAPDVRLESVLARTWGISLGPEKDTGAAATRIATLPRPLRLHVVERELFRPDEAPPAHREGELARATEAALREALPGAFREGPSAQPGELVLDVVVGPDEPLLLGLHEHGAGRSAHPGGRYVYEVPADAPSRAYRKTEEALLAFDLPLAPGDVAVELGAAPGGGAYALARRGVSVAALDPADMDAKVLAFTGPGGAKVTHVRGSMQSVERSALPAAAQWLLMDVNLAPQVALRAAGKFAAMFRSSLLGVVFTLKLNDWSFLEQLERFLGEVRAMGVVGPRARQLPAHRQEIAVAGLTARGLAARPERVTG